MPIRDIDFDEYADIIRNLASIVDSIDLDDIASCLNKAILLDAAIENTETPQSMNKSELKKTLDFDRKLLEMVIRFKLQAFKMIAKRAEELNLRNPIDTSNNVRNSNNGTSN
jgi:hypothetical protein